MPTFKKALGWTAVAVAVPLTAFAFYLSITTHRVRPPRLIGSVFVTTRPAAVYYVTEEVRSAFELVHSYEVANDDTTLVQYTAYVLHARDGATGQTKATAAFPGKRHVPLGNGPGIVGISGDILWVWDNGLEGRAADTLAVVWPRERLVALNPGLVPPKEERAYKVVAGIDGVVIEVADGRYYRLDAKTGKADPLDADALARTLGTPTAAEGFFAALPSGAASDATYTFSYLAGAFTLGEHWYALLSDQGRAAVSDYSYRNDAGAGGDEERRLHRFPFTKDRFGQTVLDVAKGEVVWDGRYRGAGLLRHPSGKKEVYLDNGELLVSHRGDGDLPAITRIRTADGTAVWSARLPLAELRQYADTGEALVFAGKSLDDAGGKERSTLVYLRPRDGQTTVLNLSE
jgi:hypothetical protein